MLLFNHTWAQNIAPPLLVTKITYPNTVVVLPTRLYHFGSESDERYYPQGSEIHEGIDNRQQIQSANIQKSIFHKRGRRAMTS